MQKINNESKEDYLKQFLRIQDTKNMEHKPQRKQINKQNNPLYSPIQHREKRVLLNKGSKIFCVSRDSKSLKYILSDNRNIYMNN